MLGKESRLDWGDNRHRSYKSLLSPLSPTLSVTSISSESSVWSFFGGKESSLDMVKRKTPVDKLISSGITMNTLYNDDVRLSDLLECGYRVEDFHKLEIEWADLVNLGLDESDWKTYKGSSMSPSSFSELYDVNFFDVFQSCGYDFTRLATVGFTSKDLKSFKGTVDIMITCGLTKSAFVSFGFTIEEWLEMGLKFEHLTHLQITKDDLSDSLEWIFKGRERAFEELFKERLGSSPSSLPEVSRTSIDPDAKARFTVVHAVINTILDGADALEKSIADSEGFEASVANMFTRKGMLEKTSRELMIATMATCSSESKISFSKTHPTKKDFPAPDSDHAFITVEGKKRKTIYMFGMFGDIVANVD